MTHPEVEAETEISVLLAERYLQDTEIGHVIGTSSSTGVLRRGADVEGRIAVDNGALRMRPLAKPGWGRESLSYGPFRRTPGLVAAVHVLNGHHASQTFYLPETPRQRLRRWLSSLLRGRSPARPRHHENLAVGLFTHESPKDPLSAGHGLVVHASTADNGELWAGVGGRPQTVLRGLQNLPLVATVVLRERGAVYYAATAPGDPALPDLPALRPIGVDPHGDADELYLGVHQRILGEVGYRVDTRVYRTDVALVPGWSQWCTTAVVADRLTGSGSMRGRSADRGQAWTVDGGDLELGAWGLAGRGTAMSAAPVPVGLLHVLVEAPRDGGVRLVFRADGAGRRWELRLTTTGSSLGVDDGSGLVEVALSDAHRLAPGREHSVQVLDDGSTVSVHLDGALVFDRFIEDARLQEATGVGLGVVGAATVRDLEAHPRSVPAPVAAEPSWQPTGEGTVVEVDERFDGEAGPLDGVVTPSGGCRWERIEGKGSIDVVGDGTGARVRATPDAPNPGRTLYGIDWPEPGFVDIALTMTPPGTARGERQNGRGGFVLWQDPANYLVINVWLDDWLEGTSVSTFYRVDGHEDMHDAVWTLTGHRVSWGVPFTLRAVFDGERFTAYLDDEPVLYRAIRDVYADAPPLRVNKVALIANEEWGDDTGTLFQRVVARRGQAISTERTDG